MYKRKKVRKLKLSSFQSFHMWMLLTALGLGYFIAMSNNVLTDRRREAQSADSLIGSADRLADAFEFYNQRRFSE